MAKKSKSNGYAELTTSEAKEKAIETAKMSDELDAMWAAWEERGWSKDGLMYARVLRRKRELGADLAEEDEAAIDLADRRTKKGAEMPPITGRRG